MWLMLNVNTNILNKNYNADICKYAKSKFHAQILELWSELHHTNPYSKADTLNEYLLYNKNILMNRKMLEPNYFGVNCNADIKIMDLYTQDCPILSKLNVERAIGTKLTILKYNTIKTLLPPSWRTRLKGQNPKDPIIRKLNLPLIKINTLWKLRLKWLSNKITKPTLQETWINIFPFLEDLEWDKILTLPYKTSREPFLQSLQYKVLNRILNCNERLAKWKIIE